MDLTPKLYATETRRMRSFFERRHVPSSDSTDLAHDVWARYVRLADTGKVATDRPVGPLLGALAQQVLRERRRSMARNPPGILTGDFAPEAKLIQLQPGGARYRGEPRRFLSDEQKAEIRAAFAAGEKLRVLGRKYGVSHMTIKKVVTA